MATGFIFIIIFHFYQSGVILNQPLELVYYCLIFSLLLVIFVYDLKRYIIPDEIILTSLVVIFFHHILKDYFFLYTFSLAGIGAALFFFLIWFFSHGKWMGFGDVNLGFLIGFFLGWPAVVVALFSAFFIGAIIGIVLIMFKKKKLKSEVPFGPFLIIGTFLGAFFSRAIINYYLSLLL
jgi:leader peptidase (prepilin peptidase)/N-methyltransferase